MKKVFFIVCFLSFVSSENTKKDQNMLSAISQVVKNHFENRSEEFDFFILGNETESLDEIVGNILKEYNNPCKVMKIKSSANVINVNQSAFFLFKTADAYQSFQKSLNLGNEYPKKFNFLVYIEAEIAVSSLMIEKPFDSPIFLRSSFINNIIGSKTIHLSTFTTFQPRMCRTNLIFTFNFFSPQTKTWKTSIFFKEKFRNFNKCELTIAFFLPQPFVFNEKEEKGISEISGYGKTFIDQIAKNLNFQFKFFPVNMKGKHTSLYKAWGWDFFIYANSLLRIQSLSKSGSFVAKYGFPTPGFSTHAFSTADYSVVISKFRPYTQFEKIFIPFENEVWYSLIGTLSIAIIVILTLKLFPKFVQNFTVGRNVKTPMLNLM